MNAIVKIDEQGRITLPPNVLDTLHFTAPGHLKVQAVKGKLELTPAQLPGSATLCEENGVLVVANADEFSAVTVIDVVRGSRL